MRAGLTLVVLAGTVLAAPARAQEPVRLEVRLAPDTAYVGQQVTLRAEAIFPGRVSRRLQRAPRFRAPTPAGFRIYDLPDRKPARRRRGRARVYRFRRAYFPLAPGRYTLTPARLSYTVRRGFFGSEDKRLVGDSLRLVVRPVPERGRPDSYMGAVGRFRIRADIQPAEVPVGGAAVLTVEIQGRGNIKALPPPRLPELPGIEIYPPSERATVATTDGTLTGSKRFRFVLVPEESGRITIPPIEYAFFDPRREQYDVARSRALELRVRAPAGAVASSEETAGDDEPAPTLRYLELAPASSPLDWVRSAGFAAVQFLPLLGLAFALRRRRRRSGPPSPRALRKRRDRELKALRPLVAEADGDGTFFARLERVLRGWSAERLGAAELRTLPSADLRGALERRGVSADTARRAADLVARLERARYRPSAPGPETRRALFSAVERVLERIDGDAPRRRSRSAAVAALALVASGLTAAPAPAQDTSRERFRSAAAHYRAGEFAAAARGFRAFVRRQQNDAHGWYNLGNAYHKLGREGRAIRAWLHALRLAPRHDATRHNLTVAGAAPALIGRIAPLAPLSTDETLLLVSILWLLGATGLAVFVLRRRRSAGIGGAAAVLLALVLLGSWAAPRLRAETGVVLGGEAALYAAPTTRAVSRTALAPGAGLRILADHGGWLRVTTLDGTEGWVPADVVGEL